MFSYEKFNLDFANRMHINVIEIFFSNVEYLLVLDYFLGKVFNYGTCQGFFFLIK
jgi:hypothetical protein